MAFELTTPILSAEKKELAVTARYYSYQDSTPTRKRYRADLFFNNEKIGDMVFEYVGQGDDKKYNFLSSDFNLPYINIVNMRNLSSYRHVGSALHEIAFRASLALGCEGRVQLEAVRNTHYFHYVLGFRNCSATEEKRYYYRLALELLQNPDERIKSDMGNAYLYLSRTAILNKIDHYQIKDQITNFATESSIDEKYFNDVERLISEAKQGTFFAKIVANLHQPYGNRPPQDPRADWNESISEAPSLYCEITNRIITLGSELIEGLEDIHSDDGEEEICKLLLGTIILCMAYQDAKYGTQSIYDNELLYPYKSLPDLQRGDIPESILFIAQQIFDTENQFLTLPDESSIKKFFPKLSELPELHDKLAELTQSSVYGIRK